MRSKAELLKLNKEQLVGLILQLQGKSSASTLDEILTYFNDNSNLPKVIKLTDMRKQHLNARIKEYDIDTVYKAIDMVGASDFLRYGGGSWKGANYDWVFNPNNFVKILEGNYVNKGSKKPISERGDLI